MIKSSKSIHGIEGLRIPRFNRLFCCFCLLVVVFLDSQSFLIIIKDYNEFRQSNAQFHNSVFFHFSPDIKNLRITSIHFSSTLS